MKSIHDNLSRRRFIQLLAGIPASMALGSVSASGADAPRFGKLIDTTRCIGCKRCMSACKRWNGLEIDRYEELTDRETSLSGNTWTVVNLRADAKNQSRRTYVKWQCQHCREPACAGVCPVTAITKLPEGPVVVDEKKCIGCRYCFQACPYKIPRFDFEKRATRKCTLCYDKMPLLLYVKPACAAACPMGAISFDYKHEIVKKAGKRLEKLKSPHYIMGLREAGGTDVLTILPTHPRDLSLVVPPMKVINQNLDKIRISASGLLAASVVAGGMQLYAHMTREEDKQTSERDQ